MSIEALREVMPAEIPGPPIYKLVAVVLADHANKNGGNVYPSIDRVRMMAGGCGEKTVRRAIREFLDRGLLVLEAPARQHSAPRYRLDLEAIERLPRAVQGGHPDRSDDAQGGHGDRSETSQGGQPDRSGTARVVSQTARVVSVTLQGGHGDHQTCSEPVFNQETGRAAVAARPSPKADGTADAVAWLALLNRSSGRAFKATESNLRPIRARQREGHTLEQAEAVVRLKVREWQGTEMARYLRPSTLFGPKFDSYLQDASNGAGPAVPGRYYME